MLISVDVVQTVEVGSIVVGSIGLAVWRIVAPIVKERDELKKADAHGAPCPLHNDVSEMVAVFKEKLENIEKLLTRQFDKLAVDVDRLYLLLRTSDDKISDLNSRVSALEALEKRNA